jgi:hypothetical protein
MKLTAMALASAFALFSTCAFAHTVRHESRDAAPSVVLHPKYGNPNGNFSGYGNRDVWGHWGADVWGHWGAYYGPMIPTGAGGR